MAIKMWGMGAQKHLQGQFSTGPSEDQNWSKEMGGHQKIDRSL